MNTKTILIVVGIIVVILLGLWMLKSSQTPVVKVPTAQEQWITFKDEFNCKSVMVTPTTTVLSFTGEGAQTAAGTKDVYQCVQNGITGLIVY